MKHIVIEGGDCLGKNTIIEGLCRVLDYDNISLRHFGKPKKGLSPTDVLDFQFKVFNKEALFVDQVRLLDIDEYGYYNNTVIWNRSHLGEYVYSQMFRGVSAYAIANKIRTFEINSFSDKDDVYLISLTASPTFFLKQEDGLSLSKTLNEKKREIKLFKTAHELSSIKNKKLLTVNRGKSFKDKDLILGEILEFIGIGVNKI